MGSTSDLPVMEKACKLLDELQVPFEVKDMGEPFAACICAEWRET